MAALWGDLAFQHSRRWLLEQANVNGNDLTWTWLYDGQGSEGTPPSYGG